VCFGPDGRLRIDRVVNREDHIERSVDGSAIDIEKAPLVRDRLRNGSNRIRGRSMIARDQKG
jgi:hypothetical protein